MKLKSFTQKFFALFLTFALLCSFMAFSVSAAGVDDGVLLVTTKNSKKYIGTAKSNFCTEYTSANGDESSFYRYENVDVNVDSKTDVTDLVALKLAVNAQNGGIDLNFDSSVNADDLTVMRKVLIGISDFDIN